MARVTEEISAPGGPTTNTAVALSRLGAEVALVSAIGDDERGQLMLASLRNEGIATDGIIVRPGPHHHSCNVIVSREPLDRTILIERGRSWNAKIGSTWRGLFGGDVLVLDVADVSLRRFLLDLPSHTVPTVQMLGPLSYLARRDLPDAFELALRHDVIVSNEPDLLDVTGTWTLSDAAAAVQPRMRGENLARCSYHARCRRVSRRDRDQELRIFQPSSSMSSTQPAPATHSWPGSPGGWPSAGPGRTVGRFANAVGALACCSLGRRRPCPAARKGRDVTGQSATDL